MLHPLRPSRALPTVALGLGGLLGWLVATVLLAAPASAHASLLSTDPADGDVLDATPETITLTFNEAVSPVAESTSLLDAAGQPMDAEVSAAGAEMTLTPGEDLAEGTYIVNWRVISADSHPVSGAFVFSVGEPSAEVIDLSGTGETDRYLALAYFTINATYYLALLLGAGLLFFATAAVPRTAWRAGPLSERFTQTLAGVLVLLTVSGLLSIPLDALWARGAGIGDLSGWPSSVSTGQVVTVALGLAGLGAAWAFRERGLGAPMVVALLAATGAPALTGHTRSYGQPVLTVVSDVVHLAAAAVWLGGVVGLCLILTTLRPAEAWIATRAVARFSTIALTTVAVLAVSGLALTWQIPGLLLDWPSLLYERLLVAKIAVVLVAVAAAAWNRFVLVPRLGSSAARVGTLSRLRRVLIGEALVLVAVLALTAILVAQVPRDANVEEAPPPRISEVFDGGEATVVLTPGTLGVNALEITLTDEYGAPLEPEDDPGVALLLEEFEIGPLEQSVTRTGPGRYTVMTDIGLEGIWTIQLAVRVDRFSEPVLRMEVEVS